MPAIDKYNDGWMSGLARDMQVDADIREWLKFLPADERKELLADIRQRVWAAGYGKDRDDG